MNTVRKIVRALAVLALLVPAGTTWAQWELDTEESSLNFISVKNDSVAETHSFTSLQGSVGRDGAIALTISLDSVETLIPVRNQRMREMLFDTERFPVASASGTVAAEFLTTLAGGGSVNTELALTLSLHGMEQSLKVPVVLVGDGAGDIQVFTPSPVIINAADFGLVSGVAALQAAAGLKAISVAVPVAAHLVFRRGQ